MGENKVLKKNKFQEEVITFQVKVNFTTGSLPPISSSWHQAP
jgi:hypothetical protein